MVQQKVELSTIIKPNRWFKQLEQNKCVFVPIVEQKKRLVQVNVETKKNCFEQTQGSSIQRYSGFSEATYARKKSIVQPSGTSENLLYPSWFDPK